MQAASACLDLHTLLMFKCLCESMTLDGGGMVQKSMLSVQCEKAPLKDL